ncbi:MAG TPA: hypothetical protein VH352_26250 [Pseudonocardiaceae bacterium]|nr:hypothetical protein [Pseudonocardiaceae bacterium]
MTRLRQVRTTTAIAAAALLVVLGPAGAPAFADTPGPSWLPPPVDMPALGSLPPENPRGAPDATFTQNTNSHCMSGNNSADQNGQRAPGGTGRPDGTHVKSDGRRVGSASRHGTRGAHGH